MANNHTTHLRKHPSNSLLQIMNRSNRQKAEANRDAPGAISLTGSGGEASRFDFDNNTEASQAQLCVGWVVNYRPHNNTYRVQVSGKTTEVTCTDVNGRGLPFSTSRAAQYPANSKVVVYYTGVTKVSYILGALPDLAGEGKLFSHNQTYNHPTHLWHRIGVRKDLYHNTFGTQFLGRYLGDARPTDSTCLGDLTFSNFAGGLINMSMWQTTVRMTNGCGIWMNFLDELMRTVAKNYQLWTPAGQINKTVSHCETMNYEGQALYDWEGLGILDEPSGAGTAQSGNDWIDVSAARTRLEKSDTIKTVAEPKEEDMHPFFRFEKFSGWFGHGGTHDVNAVPQGKYNKMLPEGDNNKVFRQSLNVSGAFSLQAAGGFSLERTVKIPYYQQAYESFDDDSDRGNEDFEYGLDREDEVYTLKPPSDIPDPLTVSVCKAMGVDDYHQREKYKPMYGFARHADENEGREYMRIDPENVNEEDPLRPYVANLRAQQFVGDLKTVNVEAEIARGRTVQYVIRKSGVYATQDGGFLIRDAFGNEIRSGVNGIELHSVSDISLMSHRRLVSMSGDDTVITANKSVDVTSVQNDVRIQAWQNMELMAAVGGDGRTLIENKGTRQFDAWVEDEQQGEDITNNGIYIVGKRTSLVSYVASLFTACKEDAYFDCRNNWTYAQSIHQIKAGFETASLVGPKLEQQSRSGLIVQPMKEVSLSNFFTKGRAVIGKTLSVGNNLLLKDWIFAGGGACLGQSVIMGGSSIENDPNVNRDDEDMEGCAVMAKNYVEIMAEINDGIELDTADKLYEMAKPLYEEEEVGNRDTIEQKQFSSRTQDQYGTEEYVFVMPAFTAEVEKMDDFALQRFYDKLDEDEEGPFPGKTRWEAPCCAVPASAYKDKKPYLIEDENEIDEYEAPELKTPEEAFSAVVVAG